MSLKEKKPTPRDGEVAWLAKYEKALAIIALCLSDSYIHDIDGCDTAFDDWDLDALSIAR